MRLIRFGKSCLLALATFLFTLTLIAPEAWAQSSVRPPDDAVNVPSSGVTAPLGQESDADVWRYLKRGSGGAPVELAPDATMPAAPGRTDTLWDTFRAEVTAAPTTATSNSGQARVIQVLGEDWRLIRLTYILPYAGWVILGVLGLLLVFYAVRGRIKIRGGRSGRTIPRFSMSHRIAHWFLASTFIVMALTGLVILLGRPHLAPLLGREVNAVLASAALQGHNLFGPIFILALVVMIFRFMRGNFFQWADFKWILKGGGLLGGHASSNHYNFGEKTWYWIVVFVGLAMSVTGLFLEFPWLTDVLAWHQLATIVHAGGAVLLIAIALGHMYIGSIGMEGSLDSMLKGEVDENWAKEHHDLWYEKVTGKKAAHDEPDDTGGGAVGETA